MIALPFLFPFHKSKSASVCRFFPGAARYYLASDKQTLDIISITFLVGLAVETA